MDPLSITASIVALLQLSNKVISYLNDVEDASKDRAKCAIEATNLHSLLTSLRFRLEEGDASSPWYAAIRGLATKKGPLDQFKETLEVLQARITSGKGRFGQAIDVLTWKFKKEEVDRILQCMERLKTLIGIALQMDHFKLSQAISNDMTFVRGLMPSMQADLESIQQGLDRAQLDALKAWISPIDFLAQQSDILRHRHQNTGQWFLSAPEFTDWLDGATSNRTLFCPGMPGAGKTMLAAVTVDHLVTSVRTSTTGVAWLYCSYKSRIEQNVEALLKAILQQLVLANTPGVVQLAKQLQQHHNTRGSRPTKDELLETLQTSSAQLTRFYIVIDALDECAVENGTRRQLSACLAQMRNSTDVRLMVTSRHIPDIVQEFRDALKIEIRARDEDIKPFIQGQLDRLPRCVQHDPELQRMIQEKVAGAIDGMFLLARLYIDSLLDKRTKSKICSTLERLSKEVKTVERAYDHAIERLESQLPEDAALAKRVLTWIVYAERALTTSELCHALAVESGETSLDIDNILDEADVVSVCAGLVTTDECSNVIRLVHYTTQEYLEGIRETWSPGGQLYIAITCLTYLSFDTFRHGRCSSDGRLEDRLIKHPFFEYAAHNWGKHASSVQENLFDLAASILTDDGSMSSIVQATSVYRYGPHLYSQNYPRIKTGLHLLSELGLHILADKILANLPSTTGHWITEKDNDSRTCLYIAALHGHEPMVHMLLAKGVDVNEDCGRHGSALFAAVRMGHTGTVELLLDSGASIEANAPKLRSILQIAFQNNDRTMALLLLQRGADAAITDQLQQTPLELACRRGWYDVVQVLMNQNLAATMTAYNSYGATLLNEACFHGHPKVVKLLLERGVDAGSPGKEGWIPIHAAASKGYSQVVQILIENGTSPNTMDNRRWMPIMYAAQRGHVEAVRVLLLNKARLDIYDNNERGPIQMASYHGFPKVVEQLATFDPSLDMRDRRGSTALHEAAAQGHLDVVLLLLGRGADANICDNQKRTPIIAASSHGHAEVVRTLMHHGANLPATVFNGWPALTMAAHNGHDDIVEMLLPTCSGSQVASSIPVSFLFLLVEKGRLSTLQLINSQLKIDFACSDPHGGSLLHAAVLHRQYDTFTFLKDLGLDMFAIDQKGDDLICYAASSGSLPLLDAVRRYVPLTRAYSERGWSPLHWACKVGAQSVVERLVQAGERGQSFATHQPASNWNPVDIAIYHGHMDMLQDLSSECKNALGPMTPGRKPAKIVANIMCDGCHHVVFGARFRCRTCYDFDYCFMCKPLLDHLHEGHGWDYNEPLISTSDFE
ncbi:hypothetical protein HBI56_146120 [Parastagonospora nodorum]|nr:hypothetical protein HBI10_166980 [Parastagonospora nodorum]KAH4015645.1 hypothetical protein HBI13_156570 [Parastagonospora nodorum]KAH4181992.1 hypothetical protein HBH42_226830 [Parastagonospora nodorum]KAH4228171.1 hypothetical protein HBI06_102090 [Parastagonospora nodorum]KAH4235842.1 hypothetical protein HBI05_146150 [Parastagonospora nodorum]